LVWVLKFLAWFLEFKYFPGKFSWEKSFEFKLLKAWFDLIWFSDFEELFTHPLAPALRGNYSSIVL
jgi:hypothetical protein